MLANELKESLAKKIAQAYYVFGEDSYLRGESVKLLVSLCGEDFVEFNYTVLDGASVDISDIIDAIGQVPFMSDRRVVLVRDFDKTLNDKEYKMLSDSIKKLEDCTLVFLRSSQKERAKTNDISKLCITVDCSPMTESEVISFIENQFAKNGYTVTKGACIKLAKYTSCDLARVVNEIKKLISFCEDTHSVTDEKVDEIVSRDVEFVVFALSNAVAEKNSIEAYKLVDQGKGDAGKSLGMLTALTNQFRRMLHVLLNKGLPTVLVAEHLGVKDFVVTKTLNLASKFKQVKLKAIVDKLEQLEYDFKSGKLADPNEALFLGVAFALTV